VLRFQTFKEDERQTKRRTDRQTDRQTDLKVTLTVVKADVVEADHKTVVSNFVLSLTAADKSYID